MSIFDTAYISELTLTNNSGHIKLLPIGRYLNQDETKTLTELGISLPEFRKDYDDPEKKLKDWLDDPDIISYVIETDEGNVPEFVDIISDSIRINDSSDSTNEVFSSRRSRDLIRDSTLNDLDPLEADYDFNNKSIFNIDSITAFAAKVMTTFYMGYPDLNIKGLFNLSDASTRNSSAIIKYHNTASMGAFYSSYRVRYSDTVLTKVLSGDTLGGLLAYGYYDTGTPDFNTDSAGAFKIYAAEDFSSATNAGTMVAMEASPIGTASKTFRFMLDGATNIATLGTVPGTTGGTLLANLNKLIVNGGMGTGTAMSQNATINAGQLGQLAGNNINTFSVGVGSAGASGLTFNAWRIADGNDWTTTAYGIGVNVNFTRFATGSTIWFGAGGGGTANGNLGFNIKIPLRPWHFKVNNTTSPTQMWLEGTNAAGIGYAISNSNTAFSTFLAFGESSTDPTATAKIEKYGSTHATKANKLEITNAGLISFLNQVSISSAGTPIALANSTLISTNFKSMVSVDGVTIWKSNGATPNGVLTGTVGDICINGLSNNVYYCRGTTVWSTLTDGIQAFAVKTGSYALTSTDRNVFYNNSTAMVATVPSAVGLGGKEFTVYQMSTGGVTLTPTGAETISGAANYILSAAGTSVTIFSNNINWFTK